MLIVAVIVSLMAGGVIGFFLGIASTKAGARSLSDIVEQEAPAKTDNPTRLVRDRFELLYPANWTMDVVDEDYDPDQMFAIESPGAAFVMFVFGDMETDPVESLQTQIDGFSKLMAESAIQPFENYGKLPGKGAVLQGRILGTKVTVKAFACYSQGMTVIIVQQYPDKDFRYVKDGLILIEESFVLKPSKQEHTPNKPDSGAGL
ncbi:MAG: hypothetical protein JXQ27_19215 [Acidobacteria bacterium]|nr:hypothetical protein [Acidobacteriota bacterium]